MKKYIIRIIIILAISIVTIFNVSYATEVNTNTNVDTRFHNPEALKVPETDINLKIENLTRGCKIYLLLSENLLKYNLEKFINNNTENPYLMEAEEAEDLQNFLNNADYLGYIDYFNELGFEVEDNEIELRHYCFCLGTSKVIGYLEYNNINYVQIEINLNENNEFKLILKDYLTSYDSSDTKFMIDEYGTETYIDLTNISYTANPEYSNITECNVTYSFYSNEDFESIERATRIAYLIIFIILIIIILIILICFIKRHIRKKQEIEDRKFWKKKLTKDEKKAEKRN